jgi:hypothetical protein
MSWGNAPFRIVAVRRNDKPTGWWTLGVWDALAADYYPLRSFDSGAKAIAGFDRWMRKRGSQSDYQLHTGNAPD